MALQKIRNEQSIDELKMIATKMVEEKLVPADVTVDKAILIAKKGREMGIAATQALQEIYIVKGRAMLKAELQLQLAIERVPGFSYDILEMSDEKCRIKFKRVGRLPFTYTYDMKKAKTTGDCMQPNYVGNKPSGSKMKDMWLKRPETMLFYRCVSNALRYFAPDYKSINLDVQIADPEVARESLDNLINVTPQTEEPPVQEEVNDEAVNVSEIMVDVEYQECDVEQAPPESVEEYKEPEEEDDDNEPRICSVTGEELTDVVYQYSKKRFGRALSYTEQEKLKGEK